MVELDVTGMTCGSCVRAVDQAVRALDPDADVQVDLATKRVRVEGRRSAEELIRALGAAGYRARVDETKQPASTSRACCGGR
jgi:copper chaperone